MNSGRMKEQGGAKAQWLETLFEGIDSQSPVLVAVSGGSDSMALLLLAHGWAQHSGHDLQAVTVDHGLRPEAAHEAAFVAGVCAGLGIPHVTLAWEGSKPSFAIQETARHARYALLDEFARELGSRVILTGHTWDDQAETVLMRALRPGGQGDGRGLSGMARETRLYGGTRIIRPLLGMRRHVLRGILGQFAQSWIEDPSNLDESFERVRLRRAIEADPRLGERASAMAAASGKLRQVQARDAARLMRECLVIRPGPVFEFNLPAGMRRDNPVTGLALQVLIAAAGGRENLVPRSRLAPVFALMDETVNEARPRARHLTLGGAVIEATREGLRLMREKRHLGSLLLHPGEAAIWDGRLQLYNGTMDTVFIEPLPRQLLSRIEEARGARFEVRPRRALLSTPALHVQANTGEGEPLLPFVEGRAAPRGLELRMAVPAVEHFCGDFDFPLLEWVESLDRHAAASLQP